MCYNQCAKDDVVVVVVVIVLLFLFYDTTRCTKRVMRGTQLSKKVKFY